MSNIMNTDAGPSVPHRPLTTGQVAEICGVTPRTVAAWTDTGQLPSHRIPNARGVGQFRRVEPVDLARFLLFHGMATALGRLRGLRPGLSIPAAPGPPARPAGRWHAALAEIRDARPGSSQHNADETPEQFARRLQAIAAVALDTDTPGD